MAELRAGVMVIAMWPFMALVRLVPGFNCVLVVETIKLVGVKPLDFSLEIAHNSCADLDWVGCEAWPHLWIRESTAPN